MFHVKRRKMGRGNTVSQPESTTATVPTTDDPRVHASATATGTEADDVLFFACLVGMVHNISLDESLDKGMAELSDIIAKEVPTV